MAMPIIARVLRCGDQDAVLCQSRSLHDMQYLGNKLSIYPDFTLAVQAARREFAPAKKILASLDCIYAPLYPARLQVAAQGRSHLFVDPKLALKFSKKLTKEHKEPD